MQIVFLMGRLDGFLWSDPGVLSITVPYFDTNDFFFSGHTGNSVIYAIEFYAMGWPKMSNFCIFVLADILIIMVLLRTHYIIDLQSGFVWGILAQRFGEKLSYYSDVKIFGYSKE